MYEGTRFQYQHGSQTIDVLFIRIQSLNVSLGDLTQETEQVLQVVNLNLSLSHRAGGGFRSPWETFLNDSKTAQDTRMKFFKFNLTPMGVIFT